jgi:glutaminase
MQVRGNRVYREGGRACPFSSGCDIACGMDYTNASMLSTADFEAKCGLGGGASVHAVPGSAEIAAWSRALLSIPV